MRFIAVIDTETTGLMSAARNGHPLASVIDVGCVVLSLDFMDGRNVAMVRETFNELARPLNPASYEESWADHALFVNGITREQIRQARAADLVARDLVAMLEKYDPLNLAAYNAGFDFHEQFLGGAEWLKSLLKNIRHRMGPVLGGVMDIAADYRQYAGIDRYTTGWKLDNACSALNIPRENAHRAWPDARDAARVFVRLNGYSDPWDAKEITYEV